MEWLALGGVTFFAALIQAATGFGFAIVAVPLFLLILNSLSAVQLTIIVTPVISIALLPGIWRQVQGRLLGRLVAGTLLGLPLGMAVYFYAGLTMLKLAVALLIVLFAALFLLENLRKRGSAGGRALSPSLAGDLAAGIVSGALTTSLGMPGPPIMIYLSAVGLEKNTLRATILALFVVSYAGGIAMQAALAGIGPETWRLAGVMVPFALAGSACGYTISGRMSQEMFRRAVLLLLLATGLYMLYSTLGAG
jgi:uncharacterized membrane protein YfcA